MNRDWSAQQQVDSPSNEITATLLMLKLIREPLARFMSLEKRNGIEIMMAIYLFEQLSTLGDSFGDSAAFVVVISFLLS